MESMYYAFIVEQFYSGISRMKHEMKNHLTNIKGLAGSSKLFGECGYKGKEK